MKTMKNLLAAAFLSFFLGLPTAQAEALTSDQVARFIAAMPELEALGDKFQDTQRRKIDRNRPMSSSLELMQGQGPEYTVLANLAARHGFTGPEQFADVGDRVMQAYMFASIPMSAEQIEATYQQGVQNVKNDASLNADQKQRILQNMEKTHSRGVRARKSAEKDLDAVRPHMAELTKLFE